MESMLIFAAGYIVGSIAYHFTIRMDRLETALTEALFWKTQYDDFREKVRDSIKKAYKKNPKKGSKKDENSGK